MKVTIPDIMHGLGRLLEIYSRPRHYPEDTEAIAKIWQREIGDLDVEVWRAGISGYCKTKTRWFPTPGEIRGVGETIARPEVSAAGLAADYARWERNWAEAPLNVPLPCPVCGGVDTWSNGGSFTVRRGVVHDEAKHTAAGVPFVDSAKQHRLPMAGAKEPVRG